MSVLEGISPKAKGIVVIMGVGTVIAAAVYGAILFNKMTNNSDNRKEGREWGKETKKNNKDDAKKQTISDAQALTIANTLHTSMDGCGTYEPEIVAEFRKLKTDGDFSAVVDAYGNRTITCWGIGSKMSLVPSLTSELNFMYKAAINKELDKNGISYTV